MGPWKPLPHQSCKESTRKRQGSEPACPTMQNKRRALVAQAVSPACLDFFTPFSRLSRDPSRDRQGAVFPQVNSDPKPAPRLLVDLTGNMAVRSQRHSRARQGTLPRCGRRRVSGANAAPTSRSPIRSVCRHRSRHRRRFFVPRARRSRARRIAWLRAPAVRSLRRATGRTNASAPEYNAADRSPPLRREAQSWLSAQFGSVGAGRPASTKSTA